VQRTSPPLLHPGGAEVARERSCRHSEGVQARLLSVNVTEPRTILLKGKEVETSIFKRAVTEAVDVDRAGLVGERRVSRRMCDEVDHALYFYPREHYAYWERELQTGPLPWGYFGENLTCEGLIEGEVRLGDVLRCGGVTVRVRQPRLPCTRLDVRAGRRLAGRLLRSRRVGFFASVLEGGALRAGDAIELVHRDPSAPTVDDLLRLSKLDAWDAEGLAALLRSEHLPEPWRELLRNKLELARAATGWHGLRPLQLVEQRRETPDARSLWLACPRGRPLAPFSAGQHLVVAWRPSPEESALRRAFAITSDPRTLDRYRITVARTQGRDGAPAGQLAAELVERAHPGEGLLATAPHGHVTLDGVRDDARGLLVISEGIGVATALPLLRERQRRLRHVPATHVHLERTPASFALRDEVERLDGHGLRRLVGFRQRPPATAATAGFDERGDLEPATLRALAAAADHVFVIGSKALTEQLSAELRGAAATLHAESYG
jgi:MOSC domain-containing protein YiiM/ferredoxin-NADP reductase